MLKLPCMGITSLGLLVDTFPILEFPSLQPPFDEDYGPFRHELFCNLRQLVPGDAANPFDALLSVLFVAKRLIDGEREIRDRFTPDVDFTSAFCPAFPRRMTLFTPMLDMMCVPPFTQESQKVAMKRGSGEKTVQQKSESRQWQPSGDKWRQNSSAPINCNSPQMPQTARQATSSLDVLAHPV